MFIIDEIKLNGELWRQNIFSPDINVELGPIWYCRIMKYLQSN